MADTTVPFFSLDREFAELKTPLLSAIEQVLESGQLLQGAAVAELEQQIARLAQRRHAVAVNSGTDALYFALKALAIGPGDEVLIPDFSFPATLTSVLRTGATPVLVDIDDSYAIDLQLAEQALSPATKALVYVHLYGLVGDFERIEAFAAKHGLLVVEDAAQAFGGERGGRRAGSLGDISCYSFDPTKVVGAPGTAGMVLTDDDDAASTARSLRLHGKNGRGEFARLGYNSQLPTLAAAMLAVKLDAEPRWLLRRRQIAHAYCTDLAALGLVVPDPQQGREHIFHKYVIQTPHRDALAASLASDQVTTLVHYPYILHQLPLLQQQPHRIVECQRATAISTQVLSLPIHPHLSDTEVQRVINAAERFQLSREEPYSRLAAEG